MSFFFLLNPKFFDPANIVQSIIADAHKKRKKNEIEQEPTLIEQKISSYKKISKEVKIVQKELEITPKDTERYKILLENQRKTYFLRIQIGRDILEAEEQEFLLMLFLSQS